MLKYRFVKSTGSVVATHKEDVAVGDVVWRDGRLLVATRDIKGAERVIGKTTLAPFDEQVDYEEELE